MPSKKFRTLSGGHVSIFVSWRPEPIEILEGETIETDNPAEIAALTACSEVAEVKRAAPKKPTLRDKREA